MSDAKLSLSFLTFIERAIKLAESVKRNIVKRKKGVAVIDDETVVKLNEFMKTTNEIADFKELLIHNTKDLN